MENNIHAGIVYSINHAVVAVMWLLVIEGWRHLHVTLTLSVEASQDSSHEHQLSTVNSWSGVGGLG